MKKLTLLFLTTVALFSCKKSEQPELIGNVALNIQREAGAFAEVNSATKAGVVIPDTYNILTTNSNGNQEDAGTGAYSVIKAGFNLRAAVGYTMSAFNVTEAVAESSNSGFGETRYFGSSSFNVVAGQTANVSFVCSMVNSQISVAFDESFTSQFSGYSVEISSPHNLERILNYSASSTLESPIGFFNVDALDPSLQVTIKGTRILDSQPKVFTQTLVIAAKTWHKLTIKATSVSGSVGVDITIDNTVVTENKDVNIDPYN